jgi:dihydrofolate reductase
VRTARTRLEREFDAASVRDLVDRVDAPVSIGGALLASAALRAGLVEDIHLIVVPVVVGGGTPVLPRDVRFDVALRAERTFSNGTVHLHYAVRH